MVERKTFNIKIADLTVQMCAESDYSRQRCTDYITESDKVDIVAVADRNRMSIAYERNEAAFSEGYSEFVDLYRAVAEQLPRFDRFVFHGAAIRAFGKGYIFTAPSGTGKSTHISLLKKYYGDKISMINGDKPILGFSDNVFTVYSCPWSGKEGWQVNTNAPIGGIILLKRGLKNRIKKIDPSKYFSELLKQAYIPETGDTKLKMLELVDMLSKQVPFYLLECDISEEAANTSFRIMSDGV